jgi:hypothetical protein
MARRNAPPPEPLVEVKEDLTEVESRFVDEFLIDRDPYAAAIRTGVARINAKKRVQQWMGDPRIARTIQKRTDGADIDKMISPQRIMAGFIDVAFDRNSPAAARNTALKELAAFKQMYPETDDEDKPQGGVLLVPAGPALADWAAAALKQQTKLKDDVKS